MWKWLRNSLSAADSHVNGSNHFIRYPCAVCELNSEKFVGTFLNEVDNCKKSLTRWYVAVRDFYVKQNWSKFCIVFGAILVLTKCVPYFTHFLCDTLGNINQKRHWTPVVFIDSMKPVTCKLIDSMKSGQSNTSCILLKTCAKITNLTFLYLKVRHVHDLHSVGINALCFG